MKRILSGIGKMSFYGAVILFAALNFQSTNAAPPKSDWAQLSKYREANVSVRDAKIAKVVFMGDSITEFWDKGESNVFANPAIINRGISGQTTEQMLWRFKQDVINLKPKYVVILAGTNDIAGNGGPISNQGIEANIAAMCDMAKANNIKVILAKILPASHYYWSPETKPIGRIIAINEWIEKYASENKYPLIDYFTPMVDDNGALRGDLSEDGVHPNAKGYSIMFKAAKDAMVSAGAIKN